MSPRVRSFITNTFRTQKRDNTERLSCYWREKRILCQNYLKKVQQICCLLDYRVILTSFFAESSSGQNSHRQGVIRGCFCQQEKGCRSQTGGSRIRNRTRRQLQRGRHFRAPTPPSTTMSGEDN